MIVLDTNVVSEMMRARPHPAVEAWFATLVPDDLALTAISIHELRFGIDRMAFSTERRRLDAMLKGLRQRRIGAVLSFDVEAAERAAAIRAARQAIGRPVAVADAFIAGTAARHDAALATRNIRDFEEAGIVLIDPWAGART